MQQTLNFDLSEQPIPVLLRGDKWDSVWSELTDNEDLNFVDASRGTSLSSLITSSVESIHTALIDGWTMMIGYSSGKDSETVLHLFLMAPDPGCKEWGRPSASTTSSCTLTH